MNKLTFVIGIAIGYVIGTRRGREGYDRLKSRVNRLWRSPQVQQTVEKAQDVLQEKAPAAGDSVDALVESIDDKLASATPAEELPGNV